MNKQAINDPGKEFEMRLSKRLKSEIMPEGIIKPHFTEWLRIAILNDTKESMKCDHEAYKAMWEKEMVDMNMYELSYAINCLLTKTPKDMSFANDYFQVRTTYLLMVEELEVAATEWNNRCTPIKEAVTKKLRFEIEMSQGKQPMPTKHKSNMKLIQ